MLQRYLLSKLKSHTIYIIHIFPSHIQDVSLSQRFTIDKVIGGAGGAAASESECSDDFWPKNHIEWLDS